MDRLKLIKLITDSFENNGIGDLIDDKKAEKLSDLYYYLVDTNKITNLTAITDECGVVLKHYVDSAMICKYVPQGAKLIDVGCGAGFPSLPIAVLREDVFVVALDSTGKKIGFVKSTAKKLLLDNIEGVCDRAEEFVVNNREKFDVCTSRAVARMNILAELCLPFVKVGGLFVPMKASKGNEELLEAQKGIEKLGASLVSVEKSCLTLNDQSIEREIYLFEKVSKTLKEFPRKYSQILKRPL